MSFPKNFTWGVACASFQCEGAWNEDGKGPNIWDDFCHDPTREHVKNRDTGDVACDSYHRYKEDVALMVQHNVKAYRFSISWARIIPDGDGEINHKGLEFYDNLVNELIANGIEPMITLYHWDLPSALQDKGGWLNRDIVKTFGRYAAVIAVHFKDRVKRYMTLNEPQCICSLGYGTGTHAPGLVMSELALAKIYHHLCLAHSEAYRTIKAIDPEAIVGTVTTGKQVYPKNHTPEAIEAAYKQNFDMTYGWEWTTNIFLDPLCLKRYDESAPQVVKDFAATIDPADWDLMEAPDFIGINVYHGEQVDDNGNIIKPYPGFPLTALKWKVSPEVMRWCTQFTNRRYGLPVMITENGLANQDWVALDGQVHDTTRIDFLHRYLIELKKGIEDGANVLGYMQWSFLDNFEWAEGYNERFGLIYVDYNTCQRIPKDSARWYAHVIETNGECL